MKIKSVLSYKIIVDKEKETVVAVIKNDCSAMAIDAILRVEQSKGYHTDFNELVKRYLINHTFSGVAKCHKEDKFSQEIGVYIAIKKATDKLKSSINKQFARYIKRQKHLTNCVEEELHINHILSYVSR